MRAEPGETDASIPLTERSPPSGDEGDEGDDEDDATLGGSYMTLSKRLLENQGQLWKAQAQRLPILCKLPFTKTHGKPRRKPSVCVGDDRVDKTTLGRRKRSRKYWVAGIGIFVLLGVIQLFSLLGKLVVVFVPDRIHDILGSWGKPGHIGAGLATWPTDFSRDILPLPCHSHNDYWRPVPLYSAIEAGCIGVEADIWLFAEELYVGHSIASLTLNRTLNSLYINPLLDVLSKQNPVDTLVPEEGPRLHGVFDTTPEQSLILLIDFKSAGSALWPFVVDALEPLRSKGYLTHINDTQIVEGPITIVGTGNTPFDLVDSNTGNPHRDIFFDAPIDTMYEPPSAETPQPPPPETPSPAPDERPNPDLKRPSKQQPAKRTLTSEEEGPGGTAPPSDPRAFTNLNSFYASVSFSTAIGHLQNGAFSAHQLEVLRGQIRGAHRRGLKVRYWDLPYWPIGLRNHVWHVLVREGVDLLNVDDLSGATKKDWRGWSHLGQGGVGK